MTNSLGTYSLVGALGLIVLLCLTEITMTARQGPVVNDCAHTTVRSWFGTFTHLDKVLCGGERKQYTGRRWRF